MVKAPLPHLPLSESLTHTLISSLLLKQIFCPIKVQYTRPCMVRPAQFGLDPSLLTCPHSPASHLEGEPLFNVPCGILPGGVYMPAVLPHLHTFQILSCFQGRGKISLPWRRISMITKKGVSPSLGLLQGIIVQTPCLTTHFTVNGVFGCFILPTWTRLNSSTRL